MDLKSAIAQLDREWEQEKGFFGRLRSGKFDASEVDKIVSILQTIASEVETSKMLDRKLVSLTWFIPLFMNWQRERVQEQGGSVEELERATNMIEGLVQRILGVP